MVLTRSQRGNINKRTHAKTLRLVGERKKKIVTEHRRTAYVALPAFASYETFRSELESVLKIGDENSYRMFEGENPRGFVTFRTITQFNAALRDHEHNIEVYPGEFAELHKLPQMKDILELCTGDSKNYDKLAAILAELPSIVYRSEKERQQLIKQKNPFVGEGSILFGDDGSKGNRKELRIFTAERNGTFIGFFASDNYERHFAPKRSDVVGEKVFGKIKINSDEKTWTIDVRSANSGGTNFPAVYDPRDETICNDIPKRESYRAVRLKRIKSSDDGRIYLNSSSLKELENFDEIDLKANNYAKKIIKLREVRQFWRYGDISGITKVAPTLMRNPRVRLTSYDAFQELYNNEFPLAMRFSSGSHRYISSKNEDCRLVVDPWVQMIMERQGLMASWLEYTKPPSTKRVRAAHATFSYDWTDEEQKQIPYLINRWKYQEGLEEDYDEPDEQTPNGKRSRFTMMKGLTDRRKVYRNPQELEEHNDAIGRLIVFSRDKGSPNDFLLASYGTATLYEETCALTAAHVVENRPRKEVDSVTKKVRFVDQQIVIYFEKGYCAQHYDNLWEVYDLQQYIAKKPMYSYEVSRCAFERQYRKDNHDCFDYAAVFFKEKIQFEHKWKLYTDELQKKQHCRFDGYGALPTRRFSQNKFSDDHKKGESKEVFFERFEGQFPSGMYGSVEKTIEKNLRCGRKRKAVHISQFGMEGHSGSAVYLTSGKAYLRDDDGLRLVAGIYVGGTDLPKQHSNSYVKFVEGFDINVPQTSICFKFTKDTVQTINKWISGAESALQNGKPLNQYSGARKRCKLISENKYDESDESNTKLKTDVHVDSFGSSNGDQMTDDVDNMCIIPTKHYFD